MTETYLERKELVTLILVVLLTLGLAMTVMPVIVLPVLAIGKVICKTLILVWMLDKIIVQAKFLYRETLSYLYMLELLQYAKKPKDFQQPELGEAETALGEILTRFILVIAVFLI